MAKNVALRTALEGKIYTDGGAVDVANEQLLRRIVALDPSVPVLFRAGIYAEAAALGLPAVVVGDLDGVGQPVNQYLTQNGGAGGGGAANNFINLHLLAQKRLKNFELARQIEAADIATLAGYIVNPAPAQVLAGPLAAAPLDAADMAPLIVRIQNRIVGLKKEEIDGVDINGIGVLDGYAPAVDAVPGALRAALGADYANLTDVQAVEIRAHTKTKIAELRRQEKLAEILGVNPLGIGALDALAPGAGPLNDAQLKVVLGAANYEHLQAADLVAIRTAAQEKIAALRTDIKLAEIIAVTDAANIARDLDVLQPGVVAPAAVDDTNLRIALAAGYEHLQAADLIRIRTAAREKIAALRTAEKIVAIDLLAVVDQPQLTELSTTLDDPGLRAKLGPNFNYLNPVQLQSIREAAAAKSIALGGLSETAKAQQKAALLIVDVRTGLVRANVKLADARAKLVRVQTEYTNACAPLLPAAVHLLVGPPLNLAKVKRTEVTAAFDLAKEAVEKAVEQNDIAVAASIEAEQALANVNAPGAAEDDVIDAAKLLEQHKTTLHQADRNMAEVDTNIDRYLNAALNPADPTHKLARANILIEKSGQLGYEDTVVDKGDNPGPNPEAADQGVIQQAGAGGMIPSYHGLQLKKEQTIHSVRDISVGVSRLVQDRSGKVATKTVNIEEATPAEQAREAIKQAKMLLTNYDPDKGDIFIKNFTPPMQAKRVLAALLLEIGDSPALQHINPENIKIRVEGWNVETGADAYSSGTGTKSMFVGDSWRTKDMFINKYIGSDLRSSLVIREEVADVAALAGQFRAVLNEARNTGVPAQPGDEIAVGYKAPGRGG